MKKRRKQRKNNKKKSILNFINNYKIYTIALALACLMMVILGTKATYSALTAKDDVQNNLGISDFRLAINEDFVPEQGYTMGKTYKKEVSFENKTNMQMFVGGASISSTARFRWHEASEPRPGPDEDELWLPETISDKDHDIVDYEINTTDWIEVDGLYYYKYKLKPGEKTTPLLYSVTPHFDIQDFYDETAGIFPEDMVELEYPTLEESTHFFVIPEALAAAATPGAYKATFFKTSPVPPEISAIYDPQVISNTP